MKGEPAGVVTEKTGMEEDRAWERRLKGNREGEGDEEKGVRRRFRKRREEEEEEEEGGRG